MARRKSELVSSLEYHLGITLPLALVRSLSFPRAFRIGERLGDLAFRVARPQRKTALVNLRIAFPERSEAEHLEILRGTCRNLGRIVVEFCHMRDLTPANVAERVTFADPAFWEANKQVVGTTGILGLSGHFGNWELAAHAVGCYGTPVHFIHRPFANPRFDEFLNEERRRAGTGLISKRAAAREVVRVLRSNGVVVVPIDQNATGRWGVFAEFFGVPASTHPGLARLAMMTGAPVYPLFLVRKDGTPNHEIVIQEPLQLAQTGDRDRDTAENLRLFNHAFELMVRKHPDHWIWMHKRWRTRPPGEPGLYP